jgi:GMP reductase
MRMLNDIKLDFHNVLIVPSQSSLTSRSDVSLEREFNFKHSGNTWKGIPVMAANMDTIGTFEMYSVLSKYKMLTCFHKFYTLDDYKKNMYLLDREWYAISTGINNFENTKELIELLNPKFLCIDVANGYTDVFCSMVTRYRKTYPNLIIIAGNVVTAEIVAMLSDIGVDIIKIGIGSGSACLTRSKTGCGYPQFSAICETNDIAHTKGSYIMSDGGITCAGDMVKAYGAGADFIMMGGLFAGHDECAGDLITIDNDRYKIFYGMSSDTAMIKHYGSKADYRSSEGKVVKVQYKGSVAHTVEDLLGGIRSGCTYIGVNQLTDLSDKCIFIRVTQQLNNILGNS